MLVPAPWCWRAGGWGGPSALCLLQDSSQGTGKAHFDKKKKHLPLPQQASSLPLSLAQATIQPLLRDGSERGSHFVFFHLPWLFYHTRCTCHAPAMPLPLTSITPSLSSQNTSDRDADPCSGICFPGRFGKQPGLNPGHSCPLRGAGPFPESCRVPPNACVNLPAWDVGKAFEEMLGTENVINSVLKRGFPGAMAVHAAKSHPHQSHHGYSKGV